MATRRPSSEVLAEAVEVEVAPPAQASARGSTVQQQQPPPGFVAVEGVPVAQATARPFAYVGVPLDDSNDGPSLSPLLPPPPAYSEVTGEAAGAGAGAGGRVHGDVNLGVGRDLTGADEAARASARRDNAAFTARKGVTQSQALSRVAEDLRAIEVARVNAKRRDAEGLDMRPHPGNRLEKTGGSLGEKGWAEDLRAIEVARVNAKRRDAEGLDMRPHPGNRLEPTEAPLGEKGWAYDADSGEGKPAAGEGWGGAGAAAGAGGGGGGGGGAPGKESESEAEEAVSSEGYQCAEYEPAEYVIPDYTSVYDKPSDKK